MRRPAMNFIKEKFNKELIGVEVGVDLGENAEEILEHMNIKKLYLIDAYKGYMGKDGIEYPGDKTDVPEEWGNIPKEHESDVKPRDVAKKEAHERLEKFKDKIVWIEKFSEDAVKEIPMADFIYLDANHNYEYVKEDIKNYWPKIKKGGVLCGHDYYDPRHPGVTKAVHEFLKKNFTEGIEASKSQIMDWLVLK